MISTFYEKIVGASSSLEADASKILCVGLCCIDIVQVCKHFPAEDSDQRCLDYRWRRGGNASNSCTVLSQFGCDPEFLGTLSALEHLKFLQDDMRKYKINFLHCPTIEDIGCPMSTVVLSLATGSRTILHHNPNLPELRLHDFEQLNLDEYSWIHFEGRNVSEVLLMMQHIESYNKSSRSKNKENDDNPAVTTKAHQPPITISVELEVSKPGLLDLLPYVDVAFISKDFAQSKGFDNMGETLRSISQDAKTGATIICAWGDRGAMARAPNGDIVQSPAFAPRKIVDSLGAGDTFNAAVLYYLNTKKFAPRDQLPDKTSESVTETNTVVKPNYNIESTERSQTEFIDRAVLHSAVTFACRVAGAKLGFGGFDGINDIYKKFL